MSVNDPAAVTPGSVLTPEHLSKAQSKPQITAENSPLLQGFMQGLEYSGSATTVSPEDLVWTANWGFNSFCLKFDYITVFDEAVETVNLNALAYLDGMIATAIENNLHLCLLTTTLPGRWAGHSIEDYSSTGEFDLFISPDKWDTANRVWEILAERYKDIPNANLSFWPVWEVGNRNLSTGLPASDYTEQDIADYLSSVTDAIRAQDPNRMIIYEVEQWGDIAGKAAPSLKVAEEKGNMLILCNFVSDMFVYASMTLEEGAHIDNNNHSLMLPEYPTYSYELDDFITPEQPLVLDGFLPAGTTINIYLKESANTAVKFYADNTLIHSEKLSRKAYNVGYPLGTLTPFASSDKLLTVTLTETADKVTITPDYDKYFSWSGIEVILPEEYAREKWYYASAYDVFLGVEAQEGLSLRNTSTILLYPTGGSDVSTATIHEDLRFTTEKIQAESSRDAIHSTFDIHKAIADNWIIRYEDAAFSGMIWSEVEEYYTDVLDGFNNCKFSWFSNDWNNITERSEISLAGAETVEYMGWSHFNLELLKLMQSYQQ